MPELYKIYMSLVIELSERSRLKISGKKSSELLNNLCSNDIKNLPIGLGIAAGFLDRFAKVIAVSSIYNFGDYFLIESDKAVHEKLLKYLVEAANFVDCKVEDLKETYKMFSVIGFEKGLMGLNIEKGNAIIKRFNTKEIPITWNTLVDRVDFFVKTEEADGFPEFLYRGGGVEQRLEEFYDIFRISMGIPEYGKDFDKTYTIMELGSEDLISYTKGCYTGQEIVARMKAYGGEPPRKIVLLKTQGHTKVKDILFRGGLEAGFITSAYENFCIGTVKKGFFTPGTILETVEKTKLTII